MALIQLKCTAEFKKKFHSAAIMQNRTMACVMRELLEKWLQEQSKEKNVG